MSPRRTRPVPTTLSASSRGRILEVQRGCWRSSSCGCRELGIRPGEVLRHLGVRKAGVAVARRRGERALVPHDCARWVAVRPLGAWPGLLLAPGRGAEGFRDVADRS